ncbi:MAG: protein translocase subunit SecF [Candidatus Koribacter versatilis]|uniref:Protein-export membrane protein SecF n=1 Tax=Candidatus Korobacter versatilis TaxID=658062 RepID=A0A932A7V0_9BACT|nr:protein translocase subunit SecF [Candidatus Koribacter versatilis]
MELFRSVNIDWLGKKWYFLGFSLVFSVAGLLSIFFWHGVPLGVDFKGGTLVYVKFTQSPQEDAVRAKTDKAGLKDARIQRYGAAANNEVLIGLEQRAANEAALDAGKNAIIGALEPADAPKDKQDLNNAGFASLRDTLIARDPLTNGGNEPAYADLARKIVEFRDKTKGGVLGSIDDLKGTVPDTVIAGLKQAFFTSDFAVRNVEIVGPQVGAQLRDRALWAIGLSLAGMLVYLWFRFELIYGVAAVVAVFHDTLITVGAFSLLNKEISLTVVAAILTLTGYSMNDTIVVFDRIRENVRLYRRESLAEIVNRSINQTLSRTILTSGLTFLTVLSLYLFGGEVLHGFSFALVVGILIGTYSSIAVAAPMLVAYQDWRAQRSGRGPVPASAETKQQKVRVKA